MVKLVQIHKTWNLPKMKNLFMNKMHGSLRLGSFDDTIENEMTQNDYKW